MPPVSKKDTPVSAMNERVAPTADATPAAAPDVDDTPDVNSADVATESGSALDPDPAAAPDLPATEEEDADRDTAPADGTAVERGSGLDVEPEANQADVTVDDPRMERVDVDNDDQPPTPLVPPFMSEGVRQDLQHATEVIDPMSGGTFRRDPDSGAITFRSKTGEEVEVN